jgi:lipopolysaccharide export LptBFGC system permease protein LptF
MPLTLYRYLLRDLLRVVGLTTVVLVSVIAFGAVIKPLADDQILGPLQVITYVGLAIVPMLQFALPFAAGFAATITFHRLTSDNEIIAMAAAGLSYRRVILPVVMLGALLTVMMVGLTQWVIPKFWGLMEQTITRDVTDLFANSISNQRPYPVGSTQIYADQLIQQDDPPDSEADERLLLIGVAAVETDDEGRVVMEVTAAQAAIDIYRDDDQTLLKLILSDTVVFRSETNEMWRSASVEPKAVVVPSVRRSEAKTMSRSELIALRATPENYESIRSRKSTLIDRLSDYALWTALQSTLQADGRLILADAGEPTREYEISADGVTAGGFHRNNDERVEIVRVVDGVPDRRYRCEAVAMTRTPSGTLSDAAFSLNLVGVEVVDLVGPDAPNYRQGLTLNTVFPEPSAMAVLNDLSVDELLARAAPLRAHNSHIERAADRLGTRRGELNWEITARIAKRYAMALTAMLLLALGSVLAMRMRHADPLAIYLCAFLPSIGDLVLISGGEQMMREGVMGAGLATMWSGNAVLAVATIWVLIRLSRN